MSRTVKSLLVAVALLSLGIHEIFADVDLPTNLSGENGIANTRHNMTHNTFDSGAGAGVIMNPYRNNYGEICVYCHTPHGANEGLAAPLWNRTFKSQTYTTYDSLGTATLTSQVNQPGLNSLTCLSCHDGTVAVDSIINMPGSGRYKASQKTSQDNAFLNSWNNTSGPDASFHGKLTPGECMVCHSKDAGMVGAGATDFTAAFIGTDLSNDHPVGIDLPTDRLGVDFHDPGVKGAKMAFYDNDADGRADSNEIRYFKNGGNYRVECASCHDPHGVLANATQLNPTFLRVSNNNSQVCLTCHNL